MLCTFVQKPFIYRQSNEKVEITYQSKDIISGSLDFVKFQMCVKITSIFNLCFAERKSGRSGAVKLRVIFFNSEY